MPLNGKVFTEIYGNFFHQFVAFVTSYVFTCSKLKSKLVSKLSLLLEKLALITG